MRLIDADAIKNKEITVDFNYWDDTFCDGVAFVADMIDAAPTVDAVPVVRCRECQYGEYDDAIEDEYCYHCKYGGFPYNKADHFCSGGERKGVGD